MLQRTADPRTKDRFLCSYYKNYPDLLGVSSDEMEIGGLMMKFNRKFQIDST